MRYISGIRKGETKMIPAAGEDHFQTVGNQEVTQAFIQTSDILRD